MSDEELSTETRETQSDPQLVLQEGEVERFNRQIRSAIASEEDSGSMLTTVVTESGQRKPVEIRFSLLPQKEDGSYNGLTGVARDIRAQRHREQKLDVLSRVLRHNVRNRLNLIFGHASILKDADEKRYRHAGEKIESAADDLMELSEKARTAQTEVGFNPSDHNQTDITELIEHLAIEHNPSNSPVVYVHIEQTDKEVRTSIEDECPPIPESDRQVINEGKETPLMHSLGIGLWLANWVADTVGGALELERQEDDSGNRAVIRLPGQ